MTLRVAGDVTTEIHPYAIGTPEQQVTARLGDVVVYLTDPQAADRIRALFDSALLEAHRLPSRVSQTWLAPQPGTYPVSIAARLTHTADLAGAYAPPTATPTPQLICELLTGSCGKSAAAAPGAPWPTPGSTSTATSPAIEPDPPMSRACG